MLSLRHGLETLRASNRRLATIDREAVIVGHVHIALRPDQPDSIVYDGASMDDIAVIVVEGLGDLLRLVIAHCCGLSVFNRR
jgi:hypothetical protein